jgi:hypothetical protein
MNGATKLYEQGQKFSCSKTLKGCGLLAHKKGAVPGGFSLPAEGGEDAAVSVHLLDGEALLLFEAFK